MRVERGADQRGAGRPLRVGLAAALVAALGVGVALSEGAGPLSGGPAAVPAPPARGDLLPALGDAPVPTAAGVAAALGPVLADPAVAGAVGAVVLDARTGEVLLDRGAGLPVVPASTAKIATAVAVLAVLPPDTRLTTRVLAGAVPGEVVLVGGGDPTLASAPGPGVGTDDDLGPARLPDLAAQVRAAAGGAPVARVLVDDSAFVGPALGPGWRPGYVTGGDVAPVSALSVDGGRTAPGRSARAADPALAAGRALAALLGAPRTSVERGAAPPGAPVLGTVRSPPVTALVERMLTRSDNDLAEALARRLAAERGLPASFAGAATALRDVLAPLTGDPQGLALVDASGLSRDDRVAPLALARLLALVVADGTGRYGPVLSGLPVAGFDGTLARRYRAGPAALAAGEVRAKTGTLSGVSALAGLVRTEDGRLLAFDLTAGAVAPGVPGPAEDALDRAAAALAACGCR